MLEVIRTEGPFIEIVGFSAGAAIAHILVFLAKHQAASELIQNLQINKNKNNI